MKKPILLITSVFFALTCLPAQADNNGNSSFNHNTAGASYSGGHRNSYLSISTNSNRSSNSFDHSASNQRQHETDRSHHRDSLSSSYNQHSNNNAQRHFNRGFDRYRDRSSYNNNIWNRRNSYNRSFYNRYYNNRSRQQGFTSGIALGLFTTGLFGNHSVIPYPPSAPLINHQFNQSSRYSNTHHRYSTNRNPKVHRTYSSSSSRSSRGECFERSYDEQGNEIKIRLESWECDF